MAILLIHTGGTIGMAQTEVGFAPKEGVIEAEMEALHKCGALMDTVDLHIMEPLIDSANAAPDDWMRISKVISDTYVEYDGFVVTHGTDTLAFTAAALCFALQGLSKPVIVTGSMLPLTVSGNDGHQNLKDALTAASTASRGVWVQFAGQILHGARVRKTHSSAFDAFAAIACDTPPVYCGEELQINGFGNWDVAVLAASPGMSVGLFEYAMSNCDGVVLRCYGSGTAPETPSLISALKIVQTRNVPVLAVSQCPEGGMALGTYAAGAVLRNNGVLDGHDMTLEAASYTKLHYALEACASPAELNAKLTSPLCGEFMS